VFVIACKYFSNCFFFFFENILKLIFL
jgi:hypothetical protein